MLSRKCPRPTRRIKTLRRRRLALGQTITVPDTPGSQRSVAQHGTGADDTPSLPYIGVLSDAHSAAHTPRVSTARYANVVPAHASGTERRSVPRWIQKVVGGSASRWSVEVHAAQGERNNWKSNKVLVLHTLDTSCHQ